MNKRKKISLMTLLSLTCVFVLAVCIFAGIQNGQLHSNDNFVATYDATPVIADNSQANNNQVATIESSNDAVQIASERENATGANNNNFNSTEYQSNPTEIAQKAIEDESPQRYANFFEEDMVASLPNKTENVFAFGSSNEDYDLSYKVDGHTLKINNKDKIDTDGYKGFNSSDPAPWSADNAKQYLIFNVIIECEIQPKATIGWFGCENYLHTTTVKLSNIQTIEALDKLDMSQVKKATCMFSGSNMIQTPTVSDAWFSNLTNIEDAKAICNYTSLNNEFINKVAESVCPNATNLYFAFANNKCGNLTSFGDIADPLTCKNASDVQYMLFNDVSLTQVYGDDGLIAYENNATSVQGMFRNCSSLKTLSVAQPGSQLAWTCNDPASDQLFKGCINLKGEKGTGYIENYTTVALARIDRGGHDDEAGYFSTSDKSSDHLYWGVVENATNVDPTLYLSSSRSSQAQNSCDIALSAENQVKENVDWLQLDKPTYTKIEFQKGDKKIKPTGMNFWFFYCLYVTEISNFNSDYIDTSNLTSLYYTFGALTALETIDLTGFNELEIINLEGTFANTGASITNGVNIKGLSKLNTSNATTMVGMFYNSTIQVDSDGCFDLSSFETSNVASMQQMFKDAKIPGKINLENFSCEAIADGEHILDMFTNCSLTTTIFASDNFNLYKKLSVPAQMFSCCSNLVGGKGTSYNDVKSQMGVNEAMSSDRAQIDGGPDSVHYGYFTERKLSAKAVAYCNSPVTGSVNDDTPTYFEFVYDENTYNKGDVIEGKGTVYRSVPVVHNPRSEEDQLPLWLLSEDYSDIDVSLAGKIKKVKFDISFKGFTKDKNGHIFESMDFWFAYFHTTDISGWENINTTNLKSMNSTFALMYNTRPDEGLSQDLDLSGFNPPNLEYIYNCFGQTNLGQITIPDGFAPKATSSCKIKDGKDDHDTAPFFKFQGSKIIFNGTIFSTNENESVNASYLFWNCTSLTTLTFGGYGTPFQTKNWTKMNGMFTNCSSIANLDLSSFNTGNATEMEKMFILCSNLRDLKLSNFDTRKVINKDGMFSSCNNLFFITIGSNWSLKMSDCNLKDVNWYDMNGNLHTIYEEHWDAGTYSVA